MQQTSCKEILITKKLKNLKENLHGLYTAGIRYGR